MVSEGKMQRYQRKRTRQSVQSLASVLWDEHQCQSVDAGVHIHLRTTSSVVYHRLSDANFKVCFLVYQFILLIYCIYCVHICKNINVCLMAHLILYLYLFIAYWLQPTGVRGKSDICVKPKFNTCRLL